MARQPKKITAKPTGRAVRIRAVLDHSSVILRDGIEISAPNLVLDQEDFNRMRAGYICLNCTEDLDTAFPDECPVCHYEMRKRQAADLEKHFEGYVALGPTTTIDDEIAQMEYLRQKENRETGRIWTPKPITVPREI